jgi:hypothetical protein
MSHQIITILGPEQSRVDESLSDAGLPPVAGAKSYCVFRASRDVPEMTDGVGYTYHHHVDMACWRGRLYVGWNSCQRDEDVWPARELYSTSTDGVDWSLPRELFPQGTSTALRMYFYHAPNGRMLAIAGLRGGTEKTNEDTKSALVVREICADHTLGEVFTLQRPRGDVKRPPMFDTSRDEQFVKACRLLLADNVFLEQQDRGRLLGERRMKWHDAAAWPGGKVPGDNDKWVAGKAFSFFRRRDGALVGVSKMGWTTISFDDGNTWQQPAVPPTLVTGKAKVWSQRTNDGRYALVYNPSRRNRFPLAIVSSDDGVSFRDMRIVQGELPIQRYAGADRSIGPQYVRGISHWADDGSRGGERAMWLAYSMNKEDIWVSSVPLPVVADDTRSEISGFDGWNVYQPKWSRIESTGDSLYLENRDPYDYPTAAHILPPGRGITISFDVVSLQAGWCPIEIDLVAKTSLATLSIVKTGRFEIRISFEGRTLNAAIDGSPIVLPFQSDRYDEPLNRICLRAGAGRNIGGKKPVEPGTDRPRDPVAFTIRNFRAVCEPDD